MSEAALKTPPPAVFPSLAWFRNLSDLMNEHRARAEHLGYVDCVARFTITTGEASFSAQITFEEFEVVAVEEGTDDNADAADFELIGDLRDWREMIESIVAGGGKPDLDHTLNRLSHMGTPFRLEQEDMLRKDYYFRYNQSLQEFFNLAANFETRFE